MIKILISKVLDHVDLSLLDQTRYKELSNIPNESVLKEKYTASILLYKLLNTNDLTYYYNEFNKPYLKNSQYYFNISHSEGIVAVGISDHEIGLDIEQVRSVPNIIYDKIFDDKEYNPKKFYTYWTRYEAAVKEKGNGIKMSLQENTCNIETINLLNDIILSVTKDDLIIIKCI